MDIFHAAFLIPLFSVGDAEAQNNNLKVVKYVVKIMLKGIL